VPEQRSAQHRAPPIRPAAPDAIIAGVNQRLPLSDLRLARLVLWAGLMLQAAAGWLFANAHAAPDWLNDQLRAPALYLRCVVLSLIIVIAARRAPPPKRRRSHHPLSAPPGFARARGRCARWRGLIGSRLWRRTRGTPAQIIAALAALLADLDNEIAAMTRRFARGFTRLRPILPIAPPALSLAPSATAATPARADTS
jgi:hypothetical protein